MLVVDDDVKLAGILTRSLGRAGYACTVAVSGDQALWAFAAVEPDALVVDVMIPHPSGSVVCRRLRDDGFAGPIIMMSARGNPDDRVDAHRAGADLFLAKPFPLVDLARALAHLTTARGA